MAEVAAGHGVSWPTAHRAFVAHAEALLGEPQPTPVLGIDETRRGKPRWESARSNGSFTVRPSRAAADDSTRSMTRSAAEMC